MFKSNNIKLIEELQKKDERIILIKNNFNKGTIISRNIGSLYFNSKYVILPDPDDILERNINWKQAFNAFIQYKEKIFVKQPELSRYMFYRNNELFITDYYIHNKFIKKELFIKVINSIDKLYLKLYIALWEDTIISYILYRNADSFCSLKRTGYFYIKNRPNINKNMFKISELKMKFIFIFLKIVFENSKNANLEKDMFNKFFTQITNYINISYISFITEENEKVLNNFIFIIKKNIKK